VAQSKGSSQLIPLPSATGIPLSIEPIINNWNSYNVVKSLVQSITSSGSDRLSPEQMNDLDTSGALDDAALGRNMNTEAPPSATPSKNTNPGMYALRPPSNMKAERVFTEAEKQAGFATRERIGQSEGGATGYNASYRFGSGTQDPKIAQMFGKKYGDNVK
jgi:hypothetical protein